MGWGEVGFFQGAKGYDYRPNYFRHLGRIFIGPKLFRYLGAKINFSTNMFFLQVGTKIFRSKLTLSPRGEFFRSLIISPLGNKKEFLGLKRHYDWRGRKFFAPKSFRHLEAKFFFQLKRSSDRCWWKFFGPNLLRHLRSICSTSNQFATCGQKWI